MAKRLVRIYIGSSKDSNYELAKKIGIAPGSEAERLFAHAFEKVEVIAQVDINTGEATVVNISTQPDVKTVN